MIKIYRLNLVESECCEVYYYIQRGERVPMHMVPTPIYDKYLSFVDYTEIMYGLMQKMHTHPHPLTPTHPPTHTHTHRAAVYELPVIHEQIDRQDATNDLYNTTYEETNPVECGNDYDYVKHEPNLILYI